MVSIGNDGKQTKQMGKKARTVEAPIKNVLNIMMYVSVGYPT